MAQIPAPTQPKTIRILGTLTEADSAAIQKVVAQIVQRFEPQSVILFGSYAAGRASGDSDVDLLVVIDTADEVAHVAARIAAGVDHPLPLDIRVLTPAELRAALVRKGVFVTDIMENGQVLYEARNA